MDAFVKMTFVRWDTGYVPKIAFYRIDNCTVEGIVNDTKLVITLVLLMVDR